MGGDTRGRLDRIRERLKTAKKLAESWEQQQEKLLRQKSMDKQEEDKQEDAGTDRLLGLYNGQP